MWKCRRSRKAFIPLASAKTRNFKIKLKKPTPHYYKSQWMKPHKFHKLSKYLLRQQHWGNSLFSANVAGCCFATLYITRNIEINHLDNFTSRNMQNLKQQSNFAKNSRKNLAEKGVYLSFFWRSWQVSKILQVTGVHSRSFKHLQNLGLNSLDTGAVFRKKGTLLNASQNTLSKSNLTSFTPFLGSKKTTPLKLWV